MHDKKRQPTNRVAVMMKTIQPVQEQTEGCAITYSYNTKRYLQCTITSFVGIKVNACFNPLIPGSDRDLTDFILMPDDFTRQLEVSKGT